MANLEKVKHYEVCDKLLSVGYFKDVKNTNELRKSIFVEKKHSGALLRPSMIAGDFTIQVAAYKAVIAEEQGKRKTRNIHSEIIYNLSYSRSISDALKQFGSHEGDSNVIIALLHEHKECLENSIFQLVNGIPTTEDENQINIDRELLTKHYKIASEEFEIGTVEDIITSRISTKDLM